MRFLFDGPPIRKDGKITVPHMTLQLTPSQFRQIERTHIATLTDDQFARVRRYEPRFPRIWPVVTPDYNNCTCALNMYLIWDKPTTLGLPLGETGDFFEYVFTHSTSGNVKGWSKKLILDTQGILCYEGKPISETGLIHHFKQKISQQKKYRPQDEEEYDLALSLPPYQGAPYEKRVTAAMKQLEQKAAKYKLKLHIYG